MARTLLLLLLFCTLAYADEYRLGRGVSLVDAQQWQLKLGAHASLFSAAQHVSSQPNSTDKQKTPYVAGLDQAGVMLYGDIASQLNFLVEYGSDDIATLSLGEHNLTTTPLQLMRLYGDYLYTDALQIKFGQFLTPIGIWNNTYIPALRWSAFTPYVATRFFPKIIVGASLHGRTLSNNRFSYAVFYHANGEYDTNKNNVPAQEFVGSELRYHFGANAKVAVPFGRFRSNTTKEICLFGGFNLLLPIGRNELSSEFLYKDGKWHEHDAFMNAWQEYAWYAQYVQHLWQSHFVSLRYGQQVRFASQNSVTWEDNNGVLGYIYRPVTPFSIKVEYRKRERSGLSSIRSDEGLATVSVLF